jgi:hypothetical protein
MIKIIIYINDLKFHFEMKSFLKVYLFKDIFIQIKFINQLKIKLP